MSGTIQPIGGDAVRAIQGNPVQPIDPTTTLTRWQDYANKVAQNAQIQASTGNLQQSTARSQQEQALAGIDHSQQLAGQVLALPAEQRSAALYQTINQVGGLIDPKTAAAIKATLPAPGDNAGATQWVLSHLYASQSAKDQIAGMGQPSGTIQTGAAQQPVVGPSALQQAQATVNGQASPAPQPVGAAYPAGLNNPQTLLPHVGTDVGNTANTGINPQTGQIQPAANVGGVTGGTNVPPGIGGGNPIPSNGHYDGGKPQATGGTSTGGAGNIVGGSNVATPKTQQANVDAFNADIQNKQTHVQAINGLQIAHDALETVATGGALPDTINKVRSALVQIANSTGFHPAGFENINLQNATMAEAKKYLTAYASQAVGAQTDLGKELSAMSNASTEINPTAARNVIGNGIANERRALIPLAETSADNPRGYLNAKSSAAGLNRLALQADMMTRDELTAAYDKMTSSERQEFLADYQRAKKAGLLNPQRQNQFKGGVTVDPTPTVTPGGPAPTVAPIVPKATLGYPDPTFVPGQ